MMPGVDPKKLATVQQVSKNIAATITVNYNEQVVTVELSSSDRHAAQMIPDLLGQFAQGLATQLQFFFAIKGEFVEIGEK